MLSTTSENSIASPKEKESQADKEAITEECHQSHRLDSPHILFHLLLHRKWRQTRTLLKSPQAYLLCQQRDLTDASCLAIAMGAAAPLDIIQLIVHIDPSILSHHDRYKATALHLGCLNGTSYECIDYLLKLDQGMASTLDIDLRCPLHHAVEYAIDCNLFPPVMICRKTSSHKNHLYMDVIEQLCHVAPGMVHAEDAHDNTPIDLVQNVKLKISEMTSPAIYKRLHEIYQQLSRTSIHVYRENKKLWECKGVHQIVQYNQEMIEE